jgi:hypothetical protein
MSHDESRARCFAPRWPTPPDGDAIRSAERHGVPGTDVLASWDALESRARRLVSRRALRVPERASLVQSAPSCFSGGKGSSKTALPSFPCVTEEPGASLGTAGAAPSFGETLPAPVCVSRLCGERPGGFRVRPRPHLSRPGALRDAGKEDASPRGSVSLPG